MFASYLIAFFLPAEISYCFIIFSLVCYCLWKDRYSLIVEDFFFCHCSIQIYFVGSHLNGFFQVLLMSIHNSRLEKILKTCEFSQNTVTSEIVRVTFISRIFNFQIIGEFLNSRGSTYVVYKAYSNSLLARTLFS